LFATCVRVDLHDTEERLEEAPVPPHRSAGRERTVALAVVVVHVDSLRGGQVVLARRLMSMVIFEMVSPSWTCQCRLLCALPAR
jgi:hypothetical protein